MNKEEDYASDSDESDEDFFIETEREADTEEEEEESECESDSEEDTEVGKNVKKSSKCSESKKRDKTKEKRTISGSDSVRSTRQTAAKKNGRKPVEKEELESDEETNKSRSDALYADFLGDVGGSSKPPAEKPKEAASSPKSTKGAKSTTPPTKAATEIFDFAGEPVTVTKSDTSSSSSSSSSAKENQEKQGVPSIKSPALRGVGAAKRPAIGGGGGVGSLLNQLGKKKKMSVLEKSQLDWKSFKSEEGIDEELKTHNKGKDGYLERQDFLQRTDLRQFEIEKGMRQTRRKN